MCQKTALQKGYTLIEILVAISIMGIIFGFGFLSFRDFSRRQSVASTARKLRGDVSNAREKAISGDKPSSGNCSSSILSGYLLRFTSQDGYQVEAQCTAGTDVIYSVSLPDDLDIVIPGVNPILFKVLSKGTNLEEETQIRITQNGTSYSQVVYISPSGDVK